MIDYYEPNLDLTLLGCGFLGPYHIGAICLLNQIWPHQPYSRLCGSSCGGVLGALIVSGIRLEVILEECMNVINDLNSRCKRLKSGPSLNRMVKESLEQYLPEDAHKICSNKLGVSVTRIWSFQNKFVDHFESREDLIEAVVAGCYVPVWAGLSAPKFRGEICLDGAYTDNSPKFKLTDKERGEGRRQVTISAFPSSVDVSPPDKSGIFMLRIMGVDFYYSWRNLERMRHTVAPYKPAIYRQYLLGGHKDMKEFVLKNNLVKCFNCYSQNKQETRPTTNYSKPLGSINQNSPASSCISCLKLLEQVDSLKIPDELINKLS